MPTIIYQGDVIEEIELGGPGSGFKDHKGRDATNQRGGSLPRDAGSVESNDEVITFLQDKIDSAERMNKKHPGMIEQRWLDKLHAAQEVYKAYVEKYGEDYPIVLIKDQPEVERRPWYGVIIAPSSKDAGMWQATTFDQQGFSGDFSSKTKGEAFWDVFNQGMTRPDPELLESVSKTDLFQAGNKWSMLPDKEKWETSIQEVLKGVTAGASLGEYYDHLLELLRTGPTVFYLDGTKEVQSIV